MMNQTVFIKSESKFCHNCGEKIVNYDKYCPFCGIEQIRYVKQATEPIKPNAKNAPGYVPSQTQRRPSEPDTLLDSVAKRINIVAHRVQKKIQEGSERFQEKFQEKQAKMQAKIESKNQQLEQRWSSQSYRTQQNAPTSKPQFTPKKKKIKKPKPPMDATGMVIGSIFTLIFWSIYLYQSAMGTHDMLGPEFLAWMEMAALFAMYGSVLELFRGLFGNEHYNVQAILIVAHTILAMNFIPYIIAFEDALLSIPAIQGLEAEVIADIIEGVEIATIIAVIGTILGFFYALWNAFSFRSRYLKYEKKFNEWSNQ